jgi:hypothetical protein
MKRILYTLAFTICLGTAFAQIVYIPDANFKNALLNSNCATLNGNSTLTDVDTNNDGEIQITEALAVDRLYVERWSIYSLEGIASFINLQILYCGSNQLTTLDVQGLTNLTQLFCFENHLTTLNVLGLTNLQYLECFYNQLTTLDVRGLTNLQALNLKGNQLSSLNVHGLMNLQYLDCFDNQLTTLDVQGCSNLQTLYCDNNHLTTLDVQGCTNLQYLNFENNQLRTLFIKNGRDEDIYIYNNPDLQYICADESQIQSIQNYCNIYGYNTLVSSYCSFASGGNYNTVKGNIQYDFDNNGCDANDRNADAIPISISDATNFGTVFTNTQGHFEFYTDSLNINLTPNLMNNYFTISPNVANITFPNDSNHVAIQNFCLTPNGVHNDVEVNLIPINPARPGFQALYKIIYRNKGNQIMQGNIAFHFDDAFLDYVYASQTPSSMNAGMLNFDYTNLLPLESREYTITMNTNSPMETPPVNGGDILQFTANINPVSNDVTPNDNTFMIYQTVVNSFDPNDKTCIQGNYIDRTQVGDYLHYVIRFENTGTYPAENIVVVDTIDVTKFDISTLVPISASHSYITRIKDNKVEFIFENINLPFDDANNDGYVAFKIKTKPTLTLNTNIQNRASIYFDYNFPIVTNRTSTVVSNLTNIENINKEIFAEISPNPAKDIAQIQCSEPVVSLSISDLSGKTLQQISSKNNIKSLAIANLSKGVYFVKNQHTTKALKCFVC